MPRPGFLAGVACLLLPACTTNPCQQEMMESAQHGLVPDCVYRLADHNLTDWQLQQRKKQAERCKKEVGCLPASAKVVLGEDGTFKITY
jgi:hypothetical protein